MRVYSENFQESSCVKCCARGSFMGSSQREATTLAQDLKFYYFSLNRVTKKEARIDILNGEPFKSECINVLDNKIRDWQSKGATLGFREGMTKED